ncbi:dipeptidase [Streptococcus pseudoporcinus]|uniref:Dipeptidase, family protein n=1 Tax=Streptococcus pseudoporcinus TaxID=361101 RepID=A0A4V6L068_9STRE|nr:dipeptidase [Streptococcus pseudoporcinus]VTS12717.1 dipeptidase, family protein [Streptococcus pseudoporcinus]VUC65435.1 dipeptidase, family protein [Streptococcus pseudoporcinus]VUC96338.1 dipeptidase, family protein [Streptococcus pseudoporcinus]VUC96732.1 dipeptidase, family protein [Streptococcus pseudoporcinus]
METYITKSHQEACVKAIKDIVSFPSVRQEGENGTPFGQAILDVLKHTLALCEELGFHTVIDPEGYYGYAELGDQKDMLAILCHLDVVPEGDRSLWHTDPFECIEKDGHLYGRGTQDDKGPTMMALYAVKALMDAGVTFNKRIRFIFGTDEETLWRCMDRYNEREEQATFGFAPDSKFPLIYAEKGLLQAKLTGSGSEALSLEVGNAYNVVPARANYSGNLFQEVKSELDKLGFEYVTKDDQLTVCGLAQHAKDAPHGINALVRLAKALFPYTDNQTIDFLANIVDEDGKGLNIFGNIEDEPSGILSFNAAGLTINKEKTEIRLDIRIPVLADKEQLVATLSKKAKTYGLTYEEFDYLAPLYVPIDSELVTTLMSVYQQKTGDTSAAISSGGATFARTMPNCVAFGAMFPDSLQTEHQENENIVLEDAYRAMDIYAEAIYRLTR